MDTWFCPECGKALAPAGARPWPRCPACGCRSRAAADVLFVAALLVLVPCVLLPEQARAVGAAVAGGLGAFSFVRLLQQWATGRVAQAASRRGSAAGRRLSWRHCQAASTKRPATRRTT